MASSSTSQTTADRRRLHRNTLQILNANSPHFLTLSLLFLPLTFSFSALLHFYFSSNDFDPFLVKALLSTKTVFAILVFALFILSTTVAGVAMITHSANQAIHRKPLTLSSATKSLSHSYTPLLSTFIAALTKLTLISLFFTFSAFVITESVKALGFHAIEFMLKFSFNIIATDVLALIILFFIVIWGSAAAIAVLESKFGFEPLRQSACQSTEFRSHSFSIVYVSGYIIGTALLINYTAVTKMGSGINIVPLLQVFAISLNSSLMMLHYVVGNTVLYVQYMVAGSETTVEEGVSGEYVRVAVNDGDDEVSEGEGNGGFGYMMYFFMILWLVISFVYLAWMLRVHS